MVNNSGLSFRQLVVLCGLVALFVSLASAQGSSIVVAPTPKPGDPVPSKSPKPTPTPKMPVAITTGEQVAETAIFWYTLGGGRERLEQIRKTTQERGKMTFVESDGRSSVANYTKFVKRGDSFDKEKVRIDQEFSNVRYSLIWLGGKVSGLYNGTVFTPTEDVSRRFENQVTHGLEALLRYKENGSTMALMPKEKLMGVDYFVVEVTDKEQRKTRFYVSAKTFRVMMLTYEDGGVTYKRKFYDYNYAQSTLVYSHTILWANDKQVEETEIGTVTFGQQVDEAMFRIG